jgi:hypothetical protein
VDDDNALINDNWQGFDFVVRGVNADEFRFKEGVL